jgi:putative peptide zinc metalloprotease protein
MKALYRLRSHFRANVRTLLTIGVASLLLLWLIIPLPHHVKIPSITIPQEEQILYVVEEGIINQIFLKQGDSVVPGQPIIQIRQEKLEKEIGKKNEEKRLLERLIEISALELDQNALIPEKRAELLALIDELHGLNATREYLDIKGRIIGTLFALDDTLQIGQTVGKNQVLGKVADLNKVSVIAFVPERMFKDIHAGQKVIFSLPYSLAQYEGTVNYIESSPASTLDFPSLGSKYKGPLGVTFDRANNSLQLVDSYFKAKITLENTKDLPFGKIGSTSLQTSPQSLLVRGLRYLYSLVVQESAL